MCATVLSKMGGRGVPDSQEAGLERNEMHTDSGDADTPQAPGEANNASFMDFFCTMVCMLQMRTRVRRPLGIPPSVLLFLGIFLDIHTAQPRTYNLSCCQSLRPTVLVHCVQLALCSVRPVPF